MFASSSIWIEGKCAIIQQKAKFSQSHELCGHFLALLYDKTTFFPNGFLLIPNSSNFPTTLSRFYDVYGNIRTTSRLQMCFWGYFQLWRFEFRHGRVLGSFSHTVRALWDDLLQETGRSGYWWEAHDGRLMIDFLGNFLDNLFLYWVNFFANLHFLCWKIEIDAQVISLWNVKCEHTHTNRCQAHFLAFSFQPNSEHNVSLRMRIHLADMNIGIFCLCCWTVFTRIV